MRQEGRAESQPVSRPRIAAAARESAAICASQRFRFCCTAGFGVRNPCHGSTRELDSDAHEGHGAGLRTIATCHAARAEEQVAASLLQKWINKVKFPRMFCLTRKKAAGRAQYARQKVPRRSEKNPEICARLKTTQCRSITIIVSRILASRGG